MIVVSCISTCFYFSNILELKWQEEEEEEKDHTHIAEECNISDILLNLLLLCSVKLKCDEVFGISSFSLGFRVSSQLHWSCLCTFQKGKNQGNPARKGHQLEPRQDWSCANTLLLQCTHSGVPETSSPTSGCWRDRTIHFLLSCLRSQVLIWAASTQLLPAPVR